MPASLSVRLPAWLLLGLKAAAKPGWPIGGCAGDVPPICGEADSLGASIDRSAGGTEAER